MSPREPQLTPPPTFAINSSRDMLEKLKREIERLAGSIIRQEIVDHGVNAAMTAWHLTEWTWREIQGSIPRVRSLTARAGNADQSRRSPARMGMPLDRQGGRVRAPWGEGARKSKIHPGAIPGNLVRNDFWR
jgi:hypothetical protein